MPLPKNKIPSELTRGIYRPDFIPKDIDLNNFIAEEQISVDRNKAREKVRRRAITAAPSPSRNQIPIPLTESEASEADRLISNTLERIVAMRGKLNYTRDALDEAISTAEGGKELGFKVDLKGKPRIKRALKKLYGEKRDTITYSMYKEMLKAKALIEKREAHDYGSGKFSDDEDDKRRDKEKN